MVIVLLLAALGAAWYFVGRPLLEAYDAYGILRDFSGGTDCAMTLTLDTELDGEITHADIDIRKTQTDGVSVTRVSQDGLAESAPVTVSAQWRVTSRTAPEMPSAVMDKLAK